MRQVGRWKTVETGLLNFLKKKFKKKKLKNFQKIASHMHWNACGRRSKNDDRGCHKNLNTLQSGVNGDARTLLLLSETGCKMSNFTVIVMWLVEKMKKVKKNTKHFLWSRELPKNSIYIFSHIMSSPIVPHLTYILLIVSIGGRFKKSQNDRFSKLKWGRRNRPAIVPKISGRSRDDHLAL